MTAKEKSDQLLIKFLTASFGTMEEYVPVPREFAKQCAIIAVDEMLALGGMVGNDLSDSFYIYWEEVKAELEKI
jgi:hypothetical protein